MAASGQMGRKTTDLDWNLSRSAVRDFFVLISVVQLEANHQADVLVDSVHCKTEQRRAARASAGREPAY